MTRTQLENIYRSNGLDNFQLRNTDDLMKVHGIDYKAVKGYKDLDDLNKSIYETFIINIFNAYGLSARMELMPQAIYYVEEIEFLAKDSPEDNFYNVAGLIVNSIDKHGKKTKIREWHDDHFDGLEKITRSNGNYLRFEYQHGTNDEGIPIREWLHVIKNGKEWY